jgi:hypothetical protein
MLEPMKILASRDRVGCVYECACGTIHVAVGPVELKFTRESLLETYEMVREAVERLEPESPEASRSRHLGIDNSQLLSN